MFSLFLLFYFFLNLSQLLCFLEIPTDIDLQINNQTETYLLKTWELVGNRKHILPVFDVNESQMIRTIDFIQQGSDFILLFETVEKGTLKNSILWSVAPFDSCEKHLHSISKRSNWQTWAYIPYYKVLVVTSQRWFQVYTRSITTKKWKRIQSVRYAYQSEQLHIITSSEPHSLQGGFLLCGAYQLLWCYPEEKHLPYYNIQRILLPQTIKNIHLHLRIEKFHSKDLIIIDESIYELKKQETKVSHSVKTKKINFHRHNSQEMNDNVKRLLPPFVKMKLFKKDVFGDAVCYMGNTVYVIFP